MPYLNFMDSGIMLSNRVKRKCYFTDTSLIYGNFNQLSVLDFPGLQHDQAYDRIHASGGGSLIFDSRAYFFDRVFVAQHSMLAVELLFQGEIVASIESSLLAGGLEMLTQFKSEPFFALSSIETISFNNWVNNQQSWTESQKSWAKAGNYALMAPNYIAADVLLGGAGTLVVAPTIMIVVPLAAPIVGIIKGIKALFK